MKYALTPVSFVALIAVGFTGVMLPMSPSAADSTDQRARIVESSLKDLSVSNDAAIARQRLETGRETDVLGDSRVVLRPEQPIDSDRAVRREVESSLHRLRRETVSRQTEDGRKARIDESLERATDG
ncbi:MAG: hypothetical protein EP301_07045 [Gammaproteobacteria bacterium]|nr:MAG: hypothetical protein EP301_07045 [Gammaproteobacteria bacterium]